MNALTDAQIKHMVDRFLQWKLPADFRPDNGVEFEPIGSKGTPYEYTREPVGTNLLTATQAEAMVRHMLESLPASDVPNDRAAYPGKPDDQYPSGDFEGPKRGGAEQ